MIIHDLIKTGVLVPGTNIPKFIADNCHYLTIVGSMAYGVSSDNSDMDVYGFVIPPKDILFPHLSGHVMDFGPQPERFGVWEQHRVKTADGKQDYDFAIYSIVKYLSLVADMNPNMAASLFTPARCVIHITDIGRMIRDRRKTFLHKGAYHKFKGYAFGQLSKIEGKGQMNSDYRAVIDFEDRHKIPHSTTLDEILVEIDSRKNDVYDDVSTTPLRAIYHYELIDYRDLYLAMNASSKRSDTTKRFGFDLKNSYHVVRLLGECEQILTEGDMDLERNREQLKSIRRGEMSLDAIKSYFETKERALERMYEESKLPHGPDWKVLTQLLLDCLEAHYGTISTAIVRQAGVENMVADLEAVIARYR